MSYTIKSGQVITVDMVLLFRKHNCQLLGLKQVALCIMRIEPINKMFVFWNGLNGTSSSSLQSSNRLASYIDTLLCSFYIRPRNSRSERSENIGITIIKKIRNRTNMKMSKIMHEFLYYALCACIYKILSKRDFFHNDLFDDISS